MSYGKTRFGTIPRTFWTSEVGVALRRAGLRPAILYLFLKSNRHANRPGNYWWGVYRLSLDQVRLDLPIFETEQAVLAAIDVLEALGLVAYDESTESVWVVDLVAERVNPAEPHQPLKFGDHKWLKLTREYEALRPSPFSALVFDRHQRQFGLLDRDRQEGRTWRRRPAHAGRPFTPRSAVSSGPHAHVQFGTIDETFWDGEAGIALQEAGEHPLIVYVYLLANPHDNMAGLYRVRVRDVLRDLEPLLNTDEEVVAAIDVLEQLGLVVSDHDRHFVWVVHMAAQRISPQAPERRLVRHDNKWDGLQRTLATLPWTPLKEQWFDHYREQFDLPISDRGEGTRWRGRRAHGDPPVATQTDVPYEGASQGASQGASAQTRSTRHRSDETTEQPVETADSADAPANVDADRAAVSSGTSAESAGSHRPHADNPSPTHTEQSQIRFGPRRLVPRAPPASKETIAALAATLQRLLLPRPWRSYDELLEATVQYCAAVEPSRATVERALEYALTEALPAGDDRIRALWRECTERRVAGRGS